MVGELRLPWWSPSLRISLADCFLEVHCGMSGARAHRTVTRANATTRSPASYRAWVEDRLSTDQAKEPFRLSSVIPGQFAEAEPALVEAAEDGQPEPRVRRLGPSGRRVDPGLSGDPGSGSRCSHATSRHRRGEDPRQRRHDALEDLARFYLDHSETPIVGGEKPHINIHCDLPALQGMAGGLHESEFGEVIPISDLRRLACDASVTRIVLGPDSGPLDVGRKARVVPHALRLAVIARDKHCAWPGGCDRHPRWCDVHHIIAWADSGETRLDNLQLLYRYHHTPTGSRSARLISGQDASAVAAALMCVGSPWIPTCGLEAGADPSRGRPHRIASSRPTTISRRDWSTSDRTSTRCSTS